MNGPLVSVIVPIYNVESYLRECVASIRAQTYDNLQIILVDDGSTDGSGPMCDALAEEDARIQVIHQKNSGSGAARNAGLDAAKGTYVYFVDSDDWVEQTLVEKTLTPMERDGYDQCVWGRIIEEEGEPSYHWGRKKPLSLRFSTPEEKRLFLCRWFLTLRLGYTVWSRAYRRDFIERIGLRFLDVEEIGAEDLDFSFRYLAAREKFQLCYLPEGLYHYRRRSGSIMLTNSQETFMVRELRLLQREEEMLAGQEIFRPFYIYGGVTLTLYLMSHIENIPAKQGLAWIRAMYQGAEDWTYLEKQARLAQGDRKGILRACGWYYGRRVCAFYQYMLDGNPWPLLGYIQVRNCRDRLRGIKARLHRS